MRSKKLLRQLKRSFANEDIEIRLADAKLAVGAIEAQESRAQIEAFIDGFPEFLTMVDGAYTQLEDRLGMAERSLELGSQELSDANSSLYRLNRTFDAMVNSLGQGFLIFGKDRICLPVYSKACEKLLECSPAGQAVAKVLKISETELDGFERWLNLMFSEKIDFADLAEVGPKQYKNAKDLIVSLEYKPVRDTEGRIEFLVIVATDRTAEYRAKAEATKMQTFVLLASSILKDRESFISYLGQARKLLTDTSTLVDNCLRSEDLNPSRLTLVRRLLHTLKGAAHSYGMLSFGDRSHAIESSLEEESDNSARLDILKKGLPELKALFETTLVEHKEIIGNLSDQTPETREIPVLKIEKIHALLVDLGPQASAVRQIYESEILSVPIQKILRKFEDAVQQTAAATGKIVQPVEYIGGDLLIAPGPLKDFLDGQSMIHVFRNMVDHGIEDAATRKASGKPSAGLIQVKSERFNRNSKSWLRLTVADDGGGIDPQKLLSFRTKHTGILNNNNSPTTAEILQMVFEPGFSTAETVTSISGRGIGLHDVKAQVEAIGGSIWVESQLRKGAKFVLEIPEQQKDAATIGASSADTLGLV